MQPIAVRILSVLDHREDTDDGNEGNIKEVKEGFITMKGNLGIFFKKRKKLPKSNFK